MKVYVGQTRSRDLIERLLLAGWGEMTCRGELPPRRHPWAYDNGAFTDWKAGRPFLEAAFLRDMDAIASMDEKPDFIVAPDLVAGGVKSLDVSRAWWSRLFRIAPLYLAVQDGMTERDVRGALDWFQGIFVGGTLPWKIQTGAAWCELAHRYHKPCHIGRCGTFHRVQWAQRIGADSLDSCLPLWSRENLAVFDAGLAPLTQGELYP